MPARPTSAAPRRAPPPPPPSRRPHYEVEHRAPDDLPPTRNVVTPTETLSRSTAGIVAALSELKHQLPVEVYHNVEPAMSQIEASTGLLRELAGSLRTYAQISSGLWRAQRENAQLKAELSAKPAHRHPPPISTAVRDTGSPAYVEALSEIRKLNRLVEEQKLVIASRDKQITALNEWSAALVSRVSGETYGSAHGGIEAVPRFWLP